MPAEIQENSVQSFSVSTFSFKMASESTDLYEKLAKEVCNYPCYDKSSDNFKDANKKNICWNDVAEASGVSSCK